MPRFDRLVTVYLSHPLARLLGSQDRSRVPILMYHSISDNLFGMSHPYFHINTLPEVFSQQMRWLRNAGYRSIDLKQACTGLEAGTDLSKTIVITFDENGKAERDDSAQGCCGYDPKSPANFGGGRIPTIVITNHGVRGVQDATPYNHYSLLRTTETAFGIDEHLANAGNTQAGVVDMQPLFKVP